VAAVVHIPAGYTAALAERLDRHSGLHVVEASEGLIVAAGMAVIARAGVHLRMERAGDRAARCHLDPQPMSSLHRPSVDVLFSSAAKAFGAGTLGVVMTGMGDDGLAGSRAIRAAGGRILTEHPDSCVVDGMPRVVRDAGLSDGQALLKHLPQTIRAWL
jgi:two-component system chemotaxis response regulator CheB